MSQTTPDQPHECAACGFPKPVGGLRSYPKNFSSNDTVWLCQICANTYAGREVTSGATDGGKALLSMAWIGNRLRRDITRDRAK